MNLTDGRSRPSGPKPEGVRQLSRILEGPGDTGNSGLRKSGTGDREGWFATPNLD